MQGHWNCTIDWVTLTVTGAYGSFADRVLNTEDAITLARLALENLNVASEAYLVIVRPDFGYAYGLVHSETGIKVDVGWSLSRQGLKVTLSGKACRAHGDARGLLAHALQLGWKPTRVDVAYDMIESGAKIGSVHDQLQSDQPVGQRYKTQYIRSRTGETLSIGSRSSMKYLRIYDKAAEQGIYGDWVRVELEIKGEFLVENAEAIAAEPCIVGHTILMMLGNIDTPLIPLIQDGLTEEQPCKVSGSLDPQTSKMRWLERSVLPTLARLHREDKQQWAEFVDMLQSMIAANEGIDTD